MLTLPARLAAAALAVALALPAARADEADPVYDGKKASAWVDTLQNDASARKRSLAVVALGNLWTLHKYKPALVNIGRSLRSDSSVAVRVQCATAVGGLRPEEALSIENDVVSALKDEKEARVRKELVAAAGRIPELAKKAVEPLAAVLKDADPATRAAAADALAKAGADAKAAAPALVPLLNDPEKTVRQAAVFALGRIAPDNPSFVAASLVKRFGEEKDGDLRRDVLVSLKLLGVKSEPVVATFAAAVADPDPETQTVAVRTLATFGTDARPAVEALFKIASTGKDKDLRVDAVRAFGAALGPDLKGRANDMIRLMESDPDFEVRVTLVEELAALGNAVKDNKDVMTALRKRLSDPQVKVREAAGAAIRRIERKPTKEPAKTPEK